MILQGDALEQLRTLPAESVHCIVTSPPYWGLRNYQVAGQIGLEDALQKYIARLVEVFREARRVLRSDGTMWVNMGDSYSGSRSKASPPDQRGKHGYSGHAGVVTSRRRDDAIIPRSDFAVDGLPAKNLIGQPWRLAFALQEAGWILRRDIIWHKRNPMPESTEDRPTSAHEYIFLFSKSARYWYDRHAWVEPGSQNTHNRLPGNVRPYRGQEAYESGDERHRTKAGLLAYSERKRAEATKNNESFDAAMAVMPETRNARSVWSMASNPSGSTTHFAAFPRELPRRCILLGCPPGGTVLDLFNGTGTTGEVALQLGRKYIGIELNPVDVKFTLQRLRNVTPGLQLEVAA